MIVLLQLMMRLVVEEDSFLRRVAESCAERGSFDKLSKMKDALDSISAGYLETDALFNSFINSTLTRDPEPGKSPLAPAFQDLHEKKKSKDLDQDKAIYRNDDRSSPEDRLRTSSDAVVIGHDTVQVDSLGKLEFSQLQTEKQAGKSGSPKGFLFNFRDRNSEFSEVSSTNSQMLLPSSFNSWRNASPGIAALKEMTPPTRTTFLREPSPKQRQPRDVLRRTLSHDSSSSLLRPHHLPSPAIEKSPKRRMKKSSDNGENGDRGYESDTAACSDISSSGYVGSESSVLGEDVYSSFEKNDGKKSWQSDDDDAITGGMAVGIKSPLKQTRGSNGQMSRKSLDSRRKSSKDHENDKSSVIAEGHGDSLELPDCRESGKIIAHIRSMSPTSPSSSSRPTLDRTNGKKSLRLTSKKRLAETMKKKSASAHVRRSLTMKMATEPEAGRRATDYDSGKRKVELGLDRGATGFLQYMDETEEQEVTIETPPKFGNPMYGQKKKSSSMTHILRDSEGWKALAEVETVGDPKKTMTASTCGQPEKEGGRGSRIRHKSCRTGERGKDAALFGSRISPHPPLQQVSSTVPSLAAIYKNCDAFDSFAQNSTRSTPNPNSFPDELAEIAHHSDTEAPMQPPTSSERLSAPVAMVDDISPEMMYCSEVVMQEPVGNPGAASSHSVSAPPLNAVIAPATPDAVLEARKGAGPLSAKTFDHNDMTSTDFPSDVCAYTTTLEMGGLGDVEMYKSELDAAGLVDRNESTSPVQSKTDGYSTPDFSAYGAEGVPIACSEKITSEPSNKGREEEDAKESEKKAEKKQEGYEEYDVGVGNWDKRFCDAILRLEAFEGVKGGGSDLKQQIRGYWNLYYLTEDFVHTAKKYGKIIISEHFLPDNKKTIRPCQVGGTAGGDKYIVHNILFKFAIDSNGLYNDGNSFVFNQPQIGIFPRLLSTDFKLSVYCKNFLFLL